MDLLEENEDNELFAEGENLDFSNEQIETNNEDNENDDPQEEKKEVKPKRVVRNPRPKLNAELLKGPKGLGNLEKCFENVQFKGKGYEEQDLKVLLKTYEHWCHRLFPKLPFKDCVEAVEKLGSKGPIQTHLKKVRSGMIDDDADTPAILPDFNSDNENEPGPSNDEFSTQTSIVEEQIELTEEQIETIRRNKERAEKLRQERLRRIQEKASINLPDNKGNTQESECIEVFNDQTVADNTEVRNSLDLESHCEEDANNRNEEKLDNDVDSESDICFHKKQSKNIFDDEEDTGGVDPSLHQASDENVEEMEVDK